MTMIEEILKEVTSQEWNKQAKEYKVGSKVQITANTADQRQQIKNVYGIDPDTNGAIGTVSGHYRLKTHLGTLYQLKVNIGGKEINIGHQNVKSV